MNREPSGDPAELDARRGRVSTEPIWTRGLVLGALGLTVLQAGVFGWLARIPDDLMAPMEKVILPKPRAASAAEKGLMILAMDGLRDEQAWLPNPRPMVSPSPSVGMTRSNRPSQMELVRSAKFRAQPFLSASSAPAPQAPAILRPEMRPPDPATPRPESPPTQLLGLTNSQMTLTDALQRRGLMRPIVVTPWKGPESLGVSWVEVAVNADGEVVLARIVESCGVKAADLQFLAACRSLRFSPQGRLPAGPEFGQLQRGRIVLRWAAPP